MSKLSAYQKLKAENLRLKQDLITLATEPQSGRGLAIRNEWTIHKAIEKAFFAGDVQSDRPDHFDGLLKQIGNAG